MGVSIFLAFGYGLLSFLSPCILPLIPIYLANIAGTQYQEGKRQRWPVLLRSLAFVIGFTLVFTLWGVGAGILGSILSNHMVLLQQIAGILLILFGLLMLAALKVSWLNFEARLRVGTVKGTGLLRPFILGAVFPVAWTPCASWVLGSILVLAGTSETAAQGAFLLAVYSLGLGLPFLAVGVAFDFLSPLFKSIRRYSTLLYIISGILLIATGILILMDKLAWLLGVI
jgi:cytochrome c-type biogenesis protein